MIKRTMCAIATGAAILGGTTNVKAQDLAAIADAISDVADSIPSFQNPGYDYKYLGKDWGLLDLGEGVENFCGDGLNQSPVNLMTPIGSYGWAYGNPLPKAKDEIFKKYTDVFDDVPILWTGNSVAVQLPPVETDSNYFTSEFAVSEMDSNSTRFDALMFNFHSPSEHTVDGRYHDLEMQVYHNASQWNDTTNLKYAAVSLLFSVEDYDQTITETENNTLQRFFDNLEFDTEGVPVVDIVTYGKVMDLANFQDRWIYKGSLTVPPCEKFVYWNVLRRIHPIKIDQLAFFKEKLRMNEATIGNSVNNRAIMPINDHGILYVNAIYFQKVKIVTTILATTLMGYFAF